MKKHNIKVIIGWILIAIQLMALIGRLLNGTPFPTGIPGFFNIIGFFSFSIVGVIFLFLGYKSNNHDRSKEEPTSQETKITEQASEKNVSYKKYFYIAVGVALVLIIVLLVVIINTFPNETDNNEKYISCDDCRGSGDVICSSCRGTGQQTCNTCGGDSVAKCTRCPKCIWCDGNGVKTVNGTLTLCSHCSSGKGDCSVCSNKRDIVCYNCVGGTTVCSKCSAGKRPCKSCDGTGKIEK